MFQSGRDRITARKNVNSRNRASARLGHLSGGGSRTEFTSLVLTIPLSLATTDIAMNVDARNELSARSKSACVGSANSIQFSSYGVSGCAPSSVTHGSSHSSAAVTRVDASLSSMRSNSLRNDSGILEGICGLSNASDHIRSFSCQHHDSFLLLFLDSDLALTCLHELNETIQGGQDCRTATVPSRAQTKSRPTPKCRTQNHEALDDSFR